MNQKQKSPVQKQLGSDQKQSHCNSLPSQRKRLLEWLREKPITTIEARRELDILGVAARIFELRHELGYNIVTSWVSGKTISGRWHKIAKYVLFAGKFGEASNDEKF